MIRPTPLIALSLAACLATAEEPKTSAPKAEEAKKEQPKKEEPKKDDKKSDSVTSTGSVTIAGKEIKYKATAATLPILRPDGKPSAQVFYTSYVPRRCKARD